MSPQLSASEFTRGFSALQDPHDTWFVDIGGEHPLPVRAWPSAKAKSLIVMFHGAVDRSNREYPQFLGYRSKVRSHAHQISIADPSLALSDELTTGWFAGSAGTPLQRLLTPFLRDLIRELKVEKVIFTGGSGGGFAALYYSWHFPDSIAVVTVPQTNVQRYHRAHRDAYLETCWPSRAGEDDATDVPCLDLRELYKTAMRNNVVYLQSNMDLGHVADQMLPFLASLSTAALRRHVIKCSFWGKVGHSGAVPTTELDAWIRAALSADETTAERIALAYELANPKESQAAPVKRKRGRNSNAPHEEVEHDPIDLRWTTEIASQLLAEGLTR